MSAAAAAHDASSLERAWHGLCSVHAQVARQVAADLDANGYLDLMAYDILFALEAAGGHLRIKSLLNHVTLSQPGLSRKVERLQEEGWVIREAAPLDRRVVIVVLTDAGRCVVQDTAQLHAERVSAYLRDHLDESAGRALTAIFGHLVRPRTDVTESG